MNTETVTPFGNPTTEPASPGQSIQPIQASKTVMPAAQVDPIGHVALGALPQPSPSGPQPQSSMASPLNTKSSSPTGAPHDLDPGASTISADNAQQDSSSGYGNQHGSKGNVVGDTNSQQGSFTAAYTSVSDTKDLRLSSQAKWGGLGSQLGSLVYTVNENGAGGVQSNAESQPKGQLVGEPGQVAAVAHELRAD